MRVLQSTDWKTALVAAVISLSLVLVLASAVLIYMWASERFDEKEIATFAQVTSAVATCVSVVAALAAATTAYLSVRESRKQVSTALYLDLKKQYDSEVSPALDKICREFALALRDRGKGTAFVEPWCKALRDQGNSRHSDAKDLNDCRRTVEDYFRNVLHMHQYDSLPEHLAVALLRDTGFAAYKLAVIPMEKELAGESWPFDEAKKTYDKLRELKKMEKEKWKIMCDPAPGEVSTWAYDNG